MGPAIFVIAILGCGEGDAPCERVRQLDTRYESEAACSEATGAALERNSAVEYPVVVAQCVVAGTAWPAVAPVDIRLPDPAPAQLSLIAANDRLPRS